MSNGFYVAQDTTNDCGYASLAMIFNLIGIEYDKDILKRILSKGLSNEVDNVESISR